MRPSSFHSVVISYFTALMVKAQETPEGLFALERQEEGGGKWLTDRRPRPLRQPPYPHQNQNCRGLVLSFETNHNGQVQEAERAFPRLRRGSDQNRAGREGPLSAKLLHVLKYKQSWPRGIIEIAIINSDGAPGGASFSIIVVGLVSHSSNRISKVQVLPPGAPLETHYFKAPQ